MTHQPDTHKVQASTTNRYIIETAVLSNERLYQQEGGEPIVYIVVDTTADLHGNAWLVSAFLLEHQAQAIAHEMNTAATCQHCQRSINLADAEHGIWVDDRGIDCEYGSYHEPVTP